MCTILCDLHSSQCLCYIPRNYFFLTLLKRILSWKVISFCLQLSFIHSFNFSFQKELKTFRIQVYVYRLAFPQFFGISFHSMKEFYFWETFHFLQEFFGLRDIKSQSIYICLHLYVIHF